MAIGCRLLGVFDGDLPHHLGPTHTKVFSSSSFHSRTLREFLTLYAVNNLFRLTFLGTYFLKSPRHSRKGSLSLSVEWGVYRPFFPITSDPSGELLIFFFFFSVKKNIRKKKEGLDFVDDRDVVEMGTRGSPMASRSYVRIEPSTGPPRKKTVFMIYTFLSRQVTY